MNEAGAKQSIFNRARNCNIALHIVMEETKVINKEADWEKVLLNISFVESNCHAMINTQLRIGRGDKP